MKVWVFPNLAINDQIYTVDAYVASKMFYVTYKKVAHIALGFLELHSTSFLRKRRFIVVFVCLLK